MEEVRFLSIKEAAKKLGLSERYLRKAVDNGDVPGFYTPKQMCIRDRHMTVCEQLHLQSSTTSWA